MFFSRKDLFSWDSGFEALLNRQKWLPCPLLHPVILNPSFLRVNSVKDLSWPAEILRCGSE